MSTILLRNHNIVLALRSTRVLRSRLACVVRCDRRPNSASMSTEPQIPEKGDKVGWNWGANHIEGQAEDIIAGDAEITSKGKQIKKKGTEDNPAVTVSRPEGGNPVVKRASELHVFEDGEEVPKNEKVSTAASEAKKK